MDKSIQILDKRFSPYISAEKIQQRINTLANEISEDFKDKTPIILGVLNGAVVFMADLLKALEINCRVSFLKVASYQGTESSGKLKEFIGLDVDVKNQSVILVEDIVDTGFTIEQLLKKIYSFEPKEIKIASLLVKPGKLKNKIKIDYTGFEIDNDFVVGYGLDYNGLGRNINGIYRLTI